MSFTHHILQAAYGNGVARTLRLDDKGNDMVRSGFKTATRPHVPPAQTKVAGAVRIP